MTSGTMRSFCLACRTIGEWLEEWCWACRASLGHGAGAPGRRRVETGRDIPPNVKDWSATLFASITEFKQTIAELEQRKERDDDVT